MYGGVGATGMYAAARATGTFGAAGVTRQEGPREWNGGGGGRSE